MVAYNSLDELEALSVPEIREAFIRVMQDVVSRAVLSEMVAAIEANDPDRLFAAIGFSPAALGPIIDQLEDAYQNSADTTVGGWPKVIPTPSGGLSVFRFDMRSSTVENDLKLNSSALITRLTTEARNNVRIALQQGAINGDSPLTTALNIVGRVDPQTKARVGGIIGLTENQAGWVANAERYLEDLDPRYFGLTMRDQRFDTIVQKAIDSETELDASTISRLVTSYKNRALQNRGDTIARTETIQSINRGEQAAHVQIVEEGLVQQSAITKEWDDVGDKKVRPEHRELAARYGEGNGIDINEPFVATNGDRMMVPGDSSMGASAASIVNCRCKPKYRVDWTAGVE